MNPSLPHTHLLQTFCSTKNALVVDPEDLVSSEFIIKLPTYVSFDYKSFSFCSRIASMGNSFAQGHLYNVHSLDFIKESIQLRDFPVECSH